MTMTPIQTTINFSTVEEEEGSSDGMNESGSEGESNGTSDEDESDEEE